MMTVKAQPTPLTIDIGRAFLLVIDMQNDFATKGGMFDRISSRSPAMLSFTNIVTAASIKPIWTTS
jgi:nicotinamidase-related amidase